MAAPSRSPFKSFRRRRKGSVNRLRRPSKSLSVSTGPSSSRSFSQSSDESQNSSYHLRTSRVLYDCPTPQDDVATVVSWTPRACSPAEAAASARFSFSSTKNRSDSKKLQSSMYFSARSLVPTPLASSLSSSFLVGRSLEEVVRYDIVLPLASKAQDDRNQRFRSQRFSDSQICEAWFVYGSVQAALVLKDARMPLYGVLIVVSVELMWVMFKWALYMSDNPEFYQNYRFIRNWARFAGKQGSDILANHKTRMIAPALMAMPKILERSSVVYSRINEKIRADEKTRAEERCGKLAR